MIRVAVLMTCFNRREVTLRCLRALFAQRSSDFSLEVFLVDDASTDGTGVAVAREFSAVRILKGTGDLYWTGGMRRAFGAALAESFDYYLWLNDDTELFVNALATLLAQSEHLRKAGCQAILVGNVQDPVDGHHTYGGLLRRSNLHPVSFQLASMGVRLQPCDAMEGNCTLIPKAVADVVGNLDPQFQHNFGDVDYGLRARRSGVPILAMPGFVGACAANPKKGAWQDPDLDFSVRWKLLMSPKGCHWNDWFYFTRRHGGFFWPVFAISPYIKVFLTSLLRGKLR